MTSYLLSLVTLAVIAGVAGLALNIQWGTTGLVNFGLFGFYMVAAYACALLTTHLGWAPWQAIIAAIVLTTVVSALVSLISLRLDDDYFAIVTLAFAESVKLIANNEDWLTRGSTGIPGIPRPFTTDVGMLLFALAGLGLVFFAFEVISRSPLGRTARALRDDPLVAETLGKNVLGARWRLFALGGAALGIAGCLHAFYYQYIDPTQFSIAMTASAFMLVILAGRGSHRGVLVSSMTVVVLIEGTRFLDDYLTWLAPHQLAALRLILIGSVLILLLIYKPQGFGPEYQFALSSFENARKSPAIGAMARTSGD
ncbi:branched-chain amino acid ABC transporter permease [Parapusillimonas sp. SGNA-6]|nr:branched-chain amino acid ABC transporter permease [Parapusillimonas sp. SGNA-6]